MRLSEWRKWGKKKMRERKGWDKKKDREAGMVKEKDKDGD